MSNTYDLQLFALCNLMIFDFFVVSTVFASFPIFHSTLPKPLDANIVSSILQADLTSLVSSISFYRKYGIASV